MAPGGGVHDDGGEAERLLEDAAGRVDVLDAHHRHERAADRQRPVLDVDRIRPHVPAPPPPPQLRHEQRADRQADDRDQLH